MKNKTIKIYKPPGNSLGSFATLFSAVEEIYQTRYVIWHLFKRDFKAQFRQTLIGYCWIIITPIMGIIPFCVLNKGRYIKAWRDWGALLRFYCYGNGHVGDCLPLLLVW